MSVAQMVVIWSLNVDFMYTSPKQAFLQNIENAHKAKIGDKFVYAVRGDQIPALRWIRLPIPTL